MLGSGHMFAVSEKRPGPDTVGLKMLCEYGPW